MPPLCVTIEIGPGRSDWISCSTVAKVEVTGVAALMMPTQFGPQSLKSFSRHNATRRFCSSSPSPPPSPIPPANATP